MSLDPTRLPRIETEYVEPHSQDLRFSLDTTSPFTPVSHAPGVHSFRLSTPTQEAVSPLERKPPRPYVNTSFNRARDEARKLLAQVLAQLRNRNMPPSVSDVIGTFQEEGKQPWHLKDVVKKQISKLDQGRRGNDGSDEEDQDYSTDATFNLMFQLQELLVKSLEQRWHIFQDDGATQGHILSDSENKSSSPFRRSRSSFSGKKSRSPSPDNRTRILVSELLSLCISVLASVVSEDCRFQTALPRPMCPPNALQALTLNVAQVLLHINTHEPQIIAQIGLALVPGFSTFQKEMYPRLIAFFDQGIINISLSNLKRLQGIENLQSTVEGAVNHPLVSIHVDEATEDRAENREQTFWNPWTTITGKTLNVQSTNAPAQPMSVYYLSSIIPPLLGNALDNIELEPLDAGDNQTAQVLQRLLRSIVDNKVDAYSDFLQIVAYHTPKARKFASTLLTAFWPHSVGHVVVSQPSLNWFCHRKVSYEHRFLAWQFRHRHNWFSGSEGSQFDCHSCRKAIHGFGLLCPYCMCVVHFDCYDHPNGSALVQYANASDSYVQRVAMIKFSAAYTPALDSTTSKVLNARSHKFHQISLFSLSLCFVCRQPLWGCINQCFKCDACPYLVHGHCLDASVQPCGQTSINSKNLTIPYSALRQSCCDHYRDILSVPQQTLARRTYEEVAIYRDILTTQLDILNNGLALGSLLLVHADKFIDTAQNQLSDFELHRTIKWCNKLLAAEELYVSPAVEEYLQENGLHRRDHSMLYDWSNLVYISASMKSPSIAFNPSNSTSSDFLNVTQIDLRPETEAEEVSHPFDMVSLSHMRDVLGHEFHIYSDAAAHILISHLHHLAFFDSKNESTFEKLENMQKDKGQSCTFPLPLGLDMSIDVETLVSAIEACLSDIDLFVNEFGFLLLIRRMWPNGLMSDYGLKRTARSVFSWIINEDSHLAVILRDYLGKKRPLPGMRVKRTVDEWPPVHRERQMYGGSTQNGGDYLASRQLLVQRYAKPWLLALHNQDVQLYAASLFNACDELANIVAPVKSNVMLGLYPSSTLSWSNHCERILYHILRLTQAQVVFSVSDTVYLQWLELVHTHEELHKGMPLNSLLKLFPRESNQRMSTIDSLTGDTLERASGLGINPWQAIMDAVQHSPQNLAKGLVWMNLLSRAGIEVPLSIYGEFIAELAAAGNPLEESCLFVKAMSASLWLRSMGRQRYQPMLAKYHLSLTSHIHRGLKDSKTKIASTDIIRFTFTSCLLLNGCQRERILEVGLVEQDFISTLPSRRKLGRETIYREPAIIDSAVMDAIEYYLSEASNEEVVALIAMFLHTFLTSSFDMETHEMDNFILKNERLLSKCAWYFYDAQRPEIIKIRTTFLLRILSVEVGPFQELLNKHILAEQDWHRRALASTRLFRIVQDVCNPAFNVDGRQWQSNVVFIFQQFFSSLWVDSREEVRLLIKTHCTSLLPAHLEAITICFDETLLKSPIADRIKLITFLTLLRVHYPSWRILSWNSVLEAMTECFKYDQPMYQDLQVLSDDVDPELTQFKFKTYLIAMALDMLADGIKADSLTHIQIKAHLARVIGFRNVSIVPTGTKAENYHLAYGDLLSVHDIGYSCFGGLVTLLDSRHKIELPLSILGNSQENDKSMEVLIGTVYADIPLNILATFEVEDVLELPVQAIKQLLEAVHVIVYKHDHENRNLSVFANHLLRKAVLKSLDIMEVDLPFEVRQVAFAVVQAYLKKSTNLTFQLIFTIVEKVLNTINKAPAHQDSLSEQGCNLVGDTLNRYSRSGLLLNLLKRPLQREIFVALKNVLEQAEIANNLKDDLTRDTFSRLHETDVSQIQNILYNLQQFVEVVHHENYDSEMMILVGKQLNLLAQRMLDGSSFLVDASPLLNIPSIILQHNKTLSKDLLPFLDSLLRITLIRLQVDSKSISRILLVTTGLRRKGQLRDTTQLVFNNILPTVFEVLGDGLRLKTRIQANTLKAILDALTSTEISPGFTAVTLHTNIFMNLIDPSYYWIDNYHWPEGQTESGFYASLAVAKVVLRASRYDASAFHRLTSATEKYGRIQLRLRSWNMLAIAVLSDAEDTFGASNLLQQLKAFSSTYVATLWPYMKPAGPLPEPAITDINQAYLAMRFWLMIARQSGEAHKVGDAVYNMVWNELWPPFESIVTMLGSEAPGSISQIMAGFIASSIADLFMFVWTLRIPISLQVSAQKAMIKRLQEFVRGEPVLVKLNRAIKAMSEVPAEISMEIIVDQAAKDIIAAEKLRMLDAKREPTRTTGDRRANVEKKATIDLLNWKDGRLHA